MLVCANLKVKTNFKCLFPPHPFLSKNTFVPCLLIYSAGFYIKLNVWGSLGLNLEYDGGPIIEIGGPIFLYKLRILEGSISFLEGSV